MGPHTLALCAVDNCLPRSGVCGCRRVFCQVDGRQASLKTCAATEYGLTAECLQLASEAGQ